jgi:hypothetical protein
MRTWQWTGKWRWWVPVLVLVIGTAVIAALVWDGDDAETSVGSADTTTTERPATTATTTTTSTTTTVPEATTTTTASTTTTDRGSVPGVVHPTARTGGGSGEVAVGWEAVPGATGYRVLRSAAPGGPFAVVADFDIGTARTTAAPDVVNIWSERHSYVPDGGALGGPDRSLRFDYVDVGPRQRCYQVIAYNGAGDGAVSGTVCGSPP